MTREGNRRAGPLIAFKFALASADPSAAASLSLIEALLISVSDRGEKAASAWMAPHSLSRKKANSFFPPSTSLVRRSPFFFLGPLATSSSFSPLDSSLSPRRSPSLPFPSLSSDAQQIDQLKQFRQWGSMTPGHPENFETKGIEVTTGESKELMVLFFLFFSSSSSSFCSSSLSAASRSKEWLLFELGPRSPSPELCAPRRFA